MTISDEIRKCVVFIGYQLADGQHRLAGSGFLMGDPGVPTFIVTAKHVIDGIKNKGIDEIWLRMNHKTAGAIWLPLGKNEWFYHPTESNVDVAVLPINIAEFLDHQILSMSTALTQSIINDDNIGLGEEVFITGLFSSHRGETKNIPIVRIGNIAAMMEERINTKDFGLMDAYLIEARSIGGLSGSPVFVNPGSVRVIKGDLKYQKDKQRFFLLGLIHGHYDVKENKLDEIESDQSNTGPSTINMGIAIVVPVLKIVQTINHISSIILTNLASHEQSTK